MIVLCENVYKTFTHKSNKADSNHWVSPYDNHLLCTLSPTDLLPTVDYFRFLYVSSSSVKTPLSSQVDNLVFIPTFNVKWGFPTILCPLFLRVLSLPWRTWLAFCRGWRHHGTRRVLQIQLNTWCLHRLQESRNTSRFAVYRYLRKMDRFCHRYLFVHSW